MTATTRVAAARSARHAPVPAGAMAAASLDKSNNQSTQVAFLLIEAMAAAGDPIELSTLARRVGMPKARVFRFLKTLQSIGYVRQDASTERYRLTLKLFHLGQAVADRTALLTEARPLMMQLRDELGHTVTLSIVETEGMRILDIVRADSPVQIVTLPGALLAFGSSAQGKVALAFGPGACTQATESVSASIAPPAPRRRKSGPNRVAALIEAVRRQGWADAPGETLAGINALSVPVRDANGELAATLTIAAPTDAIPSPPRRRQIDALLRTAATLSRNLGYSERHS